MTKFKICKSLIAVIICVQIISSCTTVRITEFKDYNNLEFLFGVNKKALLINDNEVMVGEFTKTFSKKYKKRVDFVQEYDSLFAIALKDEGLFGQIEHRESMGAFPMTLLQSIKNNQKNSSLICQY